MSILEQSPSAGERLVRYCGDVLRIELHVTEDDAYFRAGNAYVRTNFGNADIMRTAVIDEVENGGSGVDGHAWHDIPMCFCGDGHYECTLPLVETGVFEAKCVFFQEGSTEPQWVPGDNLVIKVEPACAVAENTIYNAFVRQFGCYRSQEGRGADQEGAERFLDSHEYTVVPPSGRFRDVYRELPFIMDELGFRIIQLLPV